MLSSALNITAGLSVAAAGLSSLDTALFGPATFAGVHEAFVSETIPLWRYSGASADLIQSGWRALQTGGNPRAACAALWKQSGPAIARTIRESHLSLNDNFADDRTRLFPGSTGDPFRAHLIGEDIFMVVYGRKKPPAPEQQPVLPLTRDLFHIEDTVMKAIPLEAEEPMRIAVLGPSYSKTDAIYGLRLLDLSGRPGTLIVIDNHERDEQDFIKRYHRQLPHQPHKIDLRVGPTADYLTCAALNVHAIIILHPSLPHTSLLPAFQKHLRPGGVVLWQHDWDFGQEVKQRMPIHRIFTVARDFNLERLEGIKSWRAYLTRYALNRLAINDHKFYVFALQKNLPA